MKELPNLNNKSDKNNIRTVSVTNKLAEYIPIILLLGLVYFLEREFSGVSIDKTALVAFRVMAGLILLWYGYAQFLFFLGGEKQETFKEFVRRIFDDEYSSLNFFLMFPTVLGCLGFVMAFIVFVINF